MITQAQIDDLKTAIGSGVKTVVYEDRRVTYSNLTDMLSALAWMEAQLAGKQHPLTVIRATGSRGTP